MLKKPIAFVFDNLTVGKTVSCITGPKDSCRVAVEQGQLDSPTDKCFYLNCTTRKHIIAQSKIVVLNYVGIDGSERGKIAKRSEKFGNGNSLKFRMSYLPKR